MVETRKRSTELFEDLVEALVDEGMESGEFDIDSMRFAQMEQLGHGLGKELSGRVQQGLAARQKMRMPAAFACPHCGGDCEAKPQSKQVTSLDGEVRLPETRYFCTKCRESFFPSA